MIPDDAQSANGTPLQVTGQSGVVPVRAARNDTSTDGDVDRAMDRYANGDDAAFAELYDLMAPRIYGFLLRKTRNRSLAEDLLQQTMLRIHCARGRFIRGAQVVPWAISIARRLHVDGLRRDKYEVAEGAADDIEVRCALEAVDYPADEVLHARQVVEMVQRVLSSLPETQREAFELVKQDGLSHAEAAQVLGTTVTAVKLRAHRTYEALRQGLNQLLAMRNHESPSTQRRTQG